MLDDNDMICYCCAPGSLGRVKEKELPELPEVETTRRGIEPHVVGKRVALVDIRQPALRWPVSEGLAQSVTGLRITRLDRRAKYLLFVTERGRMMLHLGMSGSLRILPRLTPPATHDHADFVFDDGTVLRYHDPRRFGSIFWLQDDDGHSLLDHLGPEPLEDGFDGALLYQRSRGRRLAVKLLIMNSSIVVGVGNIYANEALFRAGIRPDRMAMRISLARYERLASAIRIVLAEAIEAGGTTLRDFVREDGAPGYFSSRLDVYGRGGEPCTGCGSVLREIRLGQRTTVFCSRCQR